MVFYFFFFSFFTLNGTHPSPEISFLFFPTMDISQNRKNPCRFT